MRIVLLLFIISLASPGLLAGTVRKCYDCRNCEVSRHIKTVCKMESETGCLKFQGVDRTSKSLSLLTTTASFPILTLPNPFPVNEKNQVTHKHCSPPSGCGFYKHNKNFSTVYCSVCTGPLCNDARPTAQHSTWYLLWPSLAAAATAIVFYVC